MVMKLESLSKTVVDVLNELKKNDGLAMLLANNKSNPFDKSLPVVNKNDLINPKSPNAKIFPYPFDVEAEIEDGSFIRVYFNSGEFNSNEVIHESTFNIDIVVAKNLWLINDGKRAMIRPYEIMSRVIDMVGKRSLNSIIQLKIDGWQHLAVNTKFDAIRIYCSYMSVES